MRAVFRVPLVLSLLAVAMHGSELGGSATQVLQDDATFLAGLKVADGFKPTVWAGANLIQHPVAIDIDEQGRLFAAETFRWRVGGVIDVRDEMFLYPEDLAATTVADRARMIEKWLAKYPKDFFTKETEVVQMLEDPNGTGKATKSTRWADGFRDAVDGPAAGVLAYDGTVYFANIPKVWALRDQSGKGVADTRTVLADGFGPRFSISGHDLHGLAMGPDGRLYFSVGDRGYHVTTKEGKLLAAARSGAVFRCEPDGSHLELYFTGLRNPQELAFNADGDLFTVDNNADIGDQARVVYILEGGNAGWDHGWQLLGNDSFAKAGGLSGRQPDPWLEEELWRTPQPTQPAWVMPAAGLITSGPSGVAYCPGAGFSDHLADTFLVADFRGGRDSGIWSFKMNPSGAGFTLPENQKKKLIWGLPPTDVTFGYDGKIYISDWVSGWGLNKFARVVALQDVTPKAPVAAAKATAALVAAGFRQRPLKELSELLAHGDLRVRQKVQFELVRRGEAGQEVLTAVATTGTVSSARLHAIWGLGQLGRQTPAAVAPLIKLLTAADPRVRQQAAKTLGDVRYAPATPALIHALTEANVRVRAFAAIALGRIQADTALPGLLTVLRDNYEADPFLRHAAIQALTAIASPATLTALAKDPAPAVRLGAVVALRRLADPGLAAFLADPAAEVRAEAIRAVYDVGVMPAMPALIAQLNQPLPTELTEQAQRMLALRLVNAAYRYGEDAAAVALAAYAADQKQPVDARTAALKAVAAWTTAPVTDPLLGYARTPVAHANPPDAAKLKSSVMQIIADGGEEVLAVAVKLAQTNGYGVPDKALLGILTNTGIAAETRAEVIGQLAERRNPTLIALLPDLLKDGNGLLRSAAFDAQMVIDRRAGLKLAGDILQDDGSNDPEIKVISDRIGSEADWAGLAMPAPATAANLAQGKAVRWVELCAKPHPDAGADGSLLPRLTDGQYAQNGADSERTVWFEENDGRFILDLGRVTEIGRIDTWSAHQEGRAIQDVMLWGSDAETCPSASAPSLRASWKPIARVSTSGHDGGGKHGSSVLNLRGALGRYRWVLWQNLRKATTFTEIAVYPPAQAPSGLWYPFAAREKGGWETLVSGAPAAVGTCLPYIATAVAGFGAPAEGSAGLPLLAAPNLPTTADDRAHQTSFAGEEARFIVDLGQAQALKRIVTYSWDAADQATQNYVLWAADGATAPEATGKAEADLAKAGWRRIAAFNSGWAGLGGKHVTGIEAVGSGCGPWRWLLWQNPQGPLNRTAFSRIDIFAAGAPVAPLRRSLSGANVALRQHVLTALGTLPEPVALELLGAWLARLTAGTVPAELQLELTTAAAARREPAIATTLKQWQETLPATDPLATFRTSLAGGDVKKGADLFRFHLAQCSKCHSVDKEGGDAGPDLKGVGAHLTREEILESLIVPSAAVTPGFGAGNLDLKDGSSVFGSFMSQNEKEIVVKTPEGTEITVPRNQIATLTPPTSPMPPMGGILTPAELRDLVSYLASLR